MKNFEAGGVEKRLDAQPFAVTQKAFQNTYTRLQHSTNRIWTLIQDSAVHDFIKDVTLSQWDGSRYFSYISIS